MFKYWAKNRLLFGLLITTALAALFSFAFTLSPSQSVESVKTENSIYLNSEIDYQIPSPSKDQLNEIKSKEFVESCFGYYLTKTNASGSKNSKINLLLSEDLDTLSMTMFNEKTLLEKENNGENYVYLDEIAKNTLKVKSGDTIKISLAGSSFNYVVSAIYKENSLFKEGTVIVNFAGSIKETYCANAKESSLSGAFINASNESMCSQFLQSYKPLGRLKDRSEFESDEAFETYNNAILNGNYANEITNFSVKRETANKDLKSANTKLLVMFIIGSVVSGTLYFVFSEILRARKSENKYFEEILKNKKSVTTYRIIAFLFDIAIYIGLTLVFSVVLKTVTNMLIPSLISFGLILLTFVINVIQDKKYVR